MACCVANVANSTKGIKFGVHGVLPHTAGGTVWSSALVRQRPENSRHAQSYHPVCYNRSLLCAGTKQIDIISPHLGLKHRHAVLKHLHLHLDQAAAGSHNHGNRDTARK